MIYLRARTDDLPGLEPMIYQGYNPWFTSGLEPMIYFRARTHDLPGLEPMIYQG